jgi:DNA-binding CsgD family transcriptional regulator
MPGHIPSLDEADLARLREYVVSLRHDTGGSLPVDRLVGLASDVPPGAGVTLDLRASEQLGAPLVVLRLPAAAPPVRLAGLTRREAEVCSLIAEGRANKQIAARMGIALATVKDHVHRILRKTGLPNRAALAVAYQAAQAAPPANPGGNPNARGRGRHPSFGGS